MVTVNGSEAKWKRPRLGWAVVLFVLVGSLFEFGSIYADAVMSPPKHLGNFLSLVSAVFLASAGIVLMRHLMHERVSLIIMGVASGLFIFSKVIAWAGHFPFLEGAPLLGVGGFGYDALEMNTQTIALLMILIGFIRSAYVANKARFDLELQNQALRHEVGQRATVERELRASDVRYRELVAEIPDVVWRLDTSGIFTFISPAVETVFGLPPEAVVGKRLAEVFHPELAERALASLARKMQQQAGESLTPFQFHHVRPDGKVRFFEAVSAPVYGPEGQVVEIQGLSRDITAHIEANEALAASEEKYRAFVENSPMVIARVDRDLRYVFVNQAFLDAAELPREDAIGKGPEVIQHVVHPDDFARIVSQCRQVLATEARRVAEVRIRDASGQWRWYAHLAYPWYEPNGQLGGVEASARDVTDQKQAEEALRQSEETARALLNATSDLVGLIDQEGRLLALNEHLAASLGRPASELLGANYRELVVGETGRRRWENALAVLRTGRQVLFSDDYRGRHFEHCFYPVRDEQGRFTRLAFYSRDVTMLLRKEEERIRLAAAIEQAPDLVIITSADGIVQYVNPGFERNTGYARNEIAGQTTRFLRSNEHDDVFYEAIRETISRGVNWSGRMVSRRKDGSLFESDATVSPVQNEAGVISNYIWLMHDVSTEVSLERQLRQAQKMEAVGTLAGGIAHDFNNILSLILGHSELLLELLSDNEPALLSVRQIAKAGNRGAELVRQILTFSRQAERRCEPCRIGPILKEALRFLAASLPATVEIQQRIEEETGVIMADPIQIYQAVMNLCTNAYQAMGTEGGVLELTLDEVEIDASFHADAGCPVPGKYMRLSVSDTGSGIEPGVISRIFEPFFSTKKPSEGTGLGLSTVHGIVTGYGGAVTVRSAVGKGSVFEIYLPQMAAEIPVESAIEGLPGAGSERILFVDDDPDLSQMVGMMLHQLGYRVDAFTNSLAAFEAFCANPDSYDLVIVDQIMPHLMGVELAKRILQTRPGFPVFLLTGYSEGITPEQARELGIREFIMKPFSTRELGGLIRKTLDAVAARRN